MLFTKLFTLGVSHEKAEWENTLIRKLNFYNTVGLFNTIIATTVFLFLDKSNFVLWNSLVFLLSPFVYVLNCKGRLILATYLFYIIGIIVMTIYTLFMGRESLILLFFFPLIFSMIDLLPKREFWKHIMIILSIYVIVIGLLNLNYFDSGLLNLKGVELDIAKWVSLVTAFFTGMMIIGWSTMNRIRQQEKIEQMLSDKEVLLAEVFHRVKNNLNVITSLLNLKKNTSENEEVQLALDDCKNRVYAMALVHQQMLSSQSMDRLNFDVYIYELCRNIESSLHGEAIVKVELDKTQLILPMSKAVPCGLILNELVTNSYKHARVEGRELEIKVALQTIDGGIRLKVMDNGEGVQTCSFGKPQSLGFELIRSLSEQIDAKVGFENNNGCHVWLDLPISASIQ